ncbi:MAG: response regulator [Limisphaerales bacterium]
MTGTVGSDRVGQPYRILVVDDEPDIRKLNYEVLSDSGYLVDAVEDGAEAWEALHTNNYDLLITDNDMPRMTGVELLEKLYSDRKFLPVIMATGTLPPDELNHQPWFAVVTTLLKPYTLAELVNTARNALRPPFRHAAIL